MIPEQKAITVTVCDRLNSFGNVGAYIVPNPDEGIDDQMVGAMNILEAGSAIVWGFTQLDTEGGYASVDQMQLFAAHYLLGQATALLKAVQDRPEVGPPSRRRANVCTPAA